jgi:hypothetical protein
MAACQVVKRPARRSQQQAADDESQAGTDTINGQPRGQTAKAEHNGGDTVCLQRYRRRKTVLLLQPYRRH